MLKLSLRGGPAQGPGQIRPIVVLGTDDVASAVGHALRTAGLTVLLARDQTVPVLRRQMSFDDALERGSVTLGGVRACATRNLLDLLQALHHGGEVIPVTALAPDDLLCIGPIGGIIDARMRRRSLKADLRPFAPLAIGLGPGFEAGRNVHVAIETAPEATGQVLYAGATLAAHGRSAPLGGAGRERFARAPCDGVWISRRAIGDRVSEGELLGFCGDRLIFAPLRGRLRGLVRDETPVVQGMRVLEVDPRDAEAQCSGIPPRAAVIAGAVSTVVEERMAVLAGGTAWLH